MRLLGPLTVAAGIAIAVLALGYAFALPWATATWMWPDGALSYLFVASMLAAVAANTIWLGFVADWGAAVSGALNIIVAFSAMSLGLLFGVPDATMSQRGPTLALLGALVVIAIGYALWARRIPVRDTRPMPRAVRIAFCIFVAALLGVSAALLLRMPSVFPWPLRPESSLMYGSMFLGSAAMFGYAATRPTWHEARGPLLAFLAYDAVLIAPFIALVGRVKPGHEPSLWVYLVVLVGSVLLAIHYQFIDRRTRGWALERLRQSPA